MIGPAERKKLRNMIGARWISQINSYFIDNEIKNKYEDPYSTQYISLVFNGNRENEKVEAAIYDFAAIRKAEDEKEAARREEILNA